MSEIRIEVEETETGWSAYSPDVPGVGVTASTRARAEDMLREAIEFHTEGMVLESIAFSGSALPFITKGHTMSSPAAELVKDMRRVISAPLYRTYGLGVA